VIRNKKILVAVLNWGLGHATRMIPMIDQLLNDQNKITLASDGAAYNLLKNQYPKLECIELPGYNITYPSRSMIWNIGSQAPKIQHAIRSEKQFIDQWVAKNKLEVIISDNRYGCHNSATENIFVSHQLNLKVPFAGLVNRVHARLINRFNQVWIMDDKDHSLSGSLSDTKWLDSKTKVTYLGPQSRLTKVASDNQFDIAAILSGPEPQRTYLEAILIDQLARAPWKSILIQGSQKANPIQSQGNLTIRSFASAEELSGLISTTKMVICRSGYSTIMDLAKIGGKALFIPTPGQTEQIYLAEKFNYEGIAQTQNQDEVNIIQAWKNNRNFKGF